jgi:lipoprotein-anchoring transpeptidase ErfK/SrfK
MGTRLFLFRDYRTARNCFVCTAARVRTAVSAAGAERNAARGDASSALERARKEIEGMNALIATAGSARGTERLRHRAVLGLAKAETSFEAGNYRAALREARESERMAEEAATRVRARISRFQDPEVLRTWRRWVEDTVEDSRSRDAPAIVVVKEANRLDLYAEGIRVRSFTVDLGRNRLGRKLQVGDMATPEGRYSILQKKGPGTSRYHLALLLDYPTAADRRRLARAKESGAVARDAASGQLIEIHGEGGRGVDWTAGCIALSNQDMEALFTAVRVGTPVTIVGGER